MNFYYNPLDEKCKSVIGAVATTENLILNVYTDASYCKLSLYSDEKGKTEVISLSKTDFGFTLLLCNLKAGLYFYYFIADGVIYGRDDNLIATTQIPNANEKSFQLLVYNKSKTPTWTQGGIIYQIFPDRFCSVEPTFKKNQKIKKWEDMPDYLPDSNGKILNDDFYGGNFKGIISKLEYLKKLNVSIIYLNPIQKAFSNHRYDTADYMQIDSLLGDDSDFKLLCEKCAEKGIKVILDGVYNHTGDDSVYFNKYKNFESVGAYNDKNSKYYDWYIFEKYPDKYKCWWGIEILPTINKNSLEFEEYIAGENGVIEKFMRLGASGFRLDVVDELKEDFVKKIKAKILKENENGFLIGEVWEDATNKIAYDTRRHYFLGDELDSVMNYPLKNAIISYLRLGDSIELKKVCKEQINNYPFDSLNMLMNLLGTHDTPRIINELSRNVPPKTRQECATQVIEPYKIQKGLQKLKLAVVLQFLLYGIPSIYYGDEIALEGEKDPFNRRTFNWDRINCETLKFYRKISKIRKENSVFKNVKTTILQTDNKVFAFKRTLKNKEVYVFVNAGENLYDIQFESAKKNLINDEISTKFTLKNNDFIILK